MLKIDAQVHVYDADTPERPWSAQVRGHLVYPEYHPEQHLEAMRRAGVDATVLIPIPTHGYRNEVEIAAARQYPERFTVMDRMDFTAPNAPQVLDEVLSRPEVRGLRFAMTGLEETRQFVAGELDWAFAELERRNKPLMIAPFGRLGRIREIAELYPALRLAICHMDLSGTVQDGMPAPERIRRILPLARYPNISVKASSAPSYSRDAYPFRDVHAPIKELVDAFGPERVFWGSDLTQQRCTYEDAVRFMMELPFLGTAEKEMVMGRSLQRWLGWDNAGGPWI